MPQRTLAQAVSDELRDAAARLSEDQRPVLTLREHAGLSHQEIGGEMELEPSAVAELPARARLKLRLVPRGSLGAASQPCEEHARALPDLARRQGGEPLSAKDGDWPFAHLAVCRSCAAAHVAMLEASVCYRASRP